MSEVTDQDGLQPFQAPVHMPERAPDPQAIQEDPEVAHDPMIVRIRELLSSGERLSHLLKSKED
ncbi:MAG: hypothetical protein PHX93_03370 [Candidatus Peribacteraceae bacterium]|nr:hypothetical protein [Candidatus Peribacteraceae bacterium]